MICDRDSSREGDTTGLHVLVARSEADVLTLTHEAFSRTRIRRGRGARSGMAFNADRML